MTSSNENKTAAMGVLKAAANAAEAPTVTRLCTFSGFRPKVRPKTDAIPAPT